MNKSLIAAVATAATLLAAGTARAGDVYWSIGISAPPIGTVISNGPVYAPAPIYAPVPVYSPPPVVYSPPPVVYRPAPRVVYPAPVVVSRPVPIGYGYYGRGPGWGDRDHDGVPNRWDRYDNRGYGDRDRDGVPDRYDRRDDRRQDRHDDRRDNRKYSH
ncbi:MAG TPA: hypothetical protein PKJ32_05995 [Piscinibacter sp.]|nr:hypothetical protein [Piscinibacter sp.]